MMVPLYFLHGEPDPGINYIDISTHDEPSKYLVTSNGEPDDVLSQVAEDGVRFIDSLTPEERANEPEVEIKFDYPPKDWWALPDRRRRMPEPWVSREAILFVSGVAVGAWIVAAVVMWL